MNDLKEVSPARFLMFLILLVPATSLFGGTAGESDQCSNIVAITGVEKKVELLSENPGLISFRFSLSLNFVNCSKKRAFLFQNEDWPWLGDVFLADSKENALQHKYLCLDTAWPSENKSAAWREIRSIMNNSKIPNKFIRVIEPKASWDYETKIPFMIEKAGNFDKTCKPWQTIKESDPLWLQVRFLTWPINLEDDPVSSKFGKELQRKWNKKGQLIIGTLVSEPIPVRLPAR